MNPPTAEARGIPSQSSAQQILGFFIIQKQSASHGACNPESDAQSLVGESVRFSFHICAYQHKVILGHFDRFYSCSRFRISAGCSELSISIYRLTRYHCSTPSTMEPWSQDSPALRVVPPQAITYCSEPPSRKWQNFILRFCVPLISILPSCILIPAAGNTRRLVLPLILLCFSYLMRSPA